MDLSPKQQRIIKTRLDALRTVDQRRNFLEMAEQNWVVELHPHWREWRGKSSFEALGAMVVLAMTDRMREIHDLHNL